jgi:hypothetical protein
MRFLRSLLGFSILLIVAFGILNVMHPRADRTRIWGYCWDPTIWATSDVDTRQNLAPNRGD